MRFAIAAAAPCALLGLLFAAPSARAADAPAPDVPMNEPPSPVVVPPSAPARSTTAEDSSAYTPSPSRHRLEWDPRWHRFRAVEYVSTAATGAGAIAFLVFVPSSDHAKWTGPILFDTAVRDTLRLHTRSGIQTALDASFYLAAITPVQSLFDSIVLPAIDRNPDLLWQLAMMDAQAYALSGLVTAGLYDTTGRARPSYADCKAGTSVDPLCNAGKYASFPSGHMSQAMTGAGLICAHHGALPLYGGGAWDIAACVEGLTVAASVGVLRMMADRHYATDVMTGGAIGFFSGYALPMLLHYWKRPLGELVSRDDVKMSVALGGGVGPYGLQLLGVF
jgi:membrane-associated phospholipid phosphatase